MDKVQVFFKNISEILGDRNTGLLILADEQENNALAITCDALTVRYFDLYLNATTKTERLLPNVLWQIIMSAECGTFEVYVIDIVEGQYLTVLHNINTLEEYAIQAGDAVLLAYVGKLPVYVDRRLWRRQSVRYNPKGNGVALPVNVVSTTMLQKALDKAIQDEDYELASNLRDELSRRLDNENSDDPHITE